jgi:hypothetical protein
VARVGLWVTDTSGVIFPLAAEDGSSAAVTFHPQRLEGVHEAIWVDFTLFAGMTSLCGLPSSTRQLALI